MFGTLVSAAFDRGTLEYIENPDPVAAVSRNLRDKIHISCMFCRSRKVRCSGGRGGCQRCVAMGFECVYPENQKRNKRQEKNKRSRTAIQRNENTSTRIVSDEADLCSRNDHGKHGEQLALHDLQNSMFDNSCIENSFFAPWVVDSPRQHGFDCGSSSSSSSCPTSAVGLTRSESPFSARSGSDTAAASRGQALELSTVDTSLLGLSAIDSVPDLSWGEEPDIAHVDIAWEMNTDGHDMAGSALESLSLEPRGKPCAEFDSCCCLLSSISILERLVSRSTSSENRIDLLLGEVRSSIEMLAIFMACERCATRVEQNMLLAMVARQISVILEKTANCCKDMHLSGLGDTNSPQQIPELNTSTINPVDISVSTYRVNRRERRHLLRSLVTLQIVEFRQQINTIKSRYRNRPNQGQMEALIEAENHIKLAQVAISSHSNIHDSL
ncbi:uncharacterized protein TRUGW13939_09156 [Talaromyces rugulosus]|uniref:Zn(2)-C6 fungal-type domain-containing protein n=1 Tax=Talaromyces rugulosus TaxID=121627 RepID=A0A7H8R6L7_TALRU|nr:uncharacterized protein TRUGW13939_09156 [Talaromyces rugulosus]QKX62000.1 hypothetical protein TRUGW13939_09156 [Talaromyces rugulosus]